MRMLWYKIRQAVTFERIIYTLLLVVVAAVSYSVGYAAQRFPGERIDVSYIEESNSILSTSTESFNTSLSTSTLSSSATTTNTTHTTSTATAATTQTTTQPNSSGKIPINSATKEQLMSVKGIGEVFAQRIIDYREANGGFISITELMNIDGVGDKRYNQWKDCFVIA